MKLFDATTASIGQNGMAPGTRWICCLGATIPSNLLLSLHEAPIEFVATSNSNSASGTLYLVSRILSCILKLPKQALKGIILRLGLSKCTSRLMLDQLVPYDTCEKRAGRTEQQQHVTVKPK